MLGLSLSDWGAIGALLQGVTSIGLLGYATYQIRTVKSQNKRSRTLEFCNLYDRDPIIDQCLRTLRAARLSGELQTSPARYKTDIATILNYLDSLAIGIGQKLYEESLARDHLGTIVKKHVDELIPDNQTASSFDINRDNYNALVELAARWNERGLHFFDGRKPWFRRKR